MSYTYDVFVSYRRSEFILEWIRDEFIDLFRKQLEVELGERPRIFWDEQSTDDGQVATTKVLDALRHSRCLLSILSGPYFSSKWCSAEWHTFRRRAEVVGLQTGATLTVPIQLQDGKNYIELLQGEGPRPRDFREFRLFDFRGTPAHIQFQRELVKLAETVGGLISNPPPFNPDWPLLKPDQMQVSDLSPGSWTYKLARDPADGQDAH